MRILSHCAHGLNRVTRSAQLTLRHLDESLDALQVKPEAENLVRWIPFNFRRQTRRAKTVRQ